MFVVYDIIRKESVELVWVRKWDGWITQPQMSPGKLAMARAQVAWAKRHFPHLLQPWLD